MKQSYRSRGLFVLTLSVALSGFILLAKEKKEEPPIDPATGMKIAEGWELVRTHCTVCHSAQQYLKQKGTESTWADTILWMQTSAGLWPLDEVTEKTIVTYLASNYGPDEAFRRAPIPSTLMPVNPYASETKLEYEQKKETGEIPLGPAGK